MGMDFTYTLENIGNIDKASISIRPLTIIAGENSSGKTFVTKTLYTVLNSIYKKHFTNALLNARNQALTLLFKGTFLDNLEKKDKELHEKCLHFIYEDGLDAINEIISANFNEQNNLIQKYEPLFLSFQQKITEYCNNKLTDEVHSVLLLSLDNFIDIFTHREATIVERIDSDLKNGLKKNFQITKLKQLIKHGEKNAKLTIDTIGEVEIDSKDSINFSFQTTGIEKIQNVGNIVFFDSPVYTKVRKALEKKEINLSLQQDENKYLKGYPEYIEELYNFIDKEYIDTPDFDAISHEIQARIAGHLDVSPSGDIHYTNANNNTIPLSLTAMGISNVGLIDLLLRNNIINKGSFLIMDEPEVHLHPQWQVFLAQVLYKIAKNGANIIIATHSLDFLKAFETILKDENENAQEVIAINKMPYDEAFSSLTELEKVGYVLDDLSKPFYDLYMQDS